MDDGIKQVGNIYPDTEGFKNKTSGRVYSIEGLAPTLNTAHGGAMLDTYNQQVQYDVSCTIRTNINTANHHFIVEETCDTKDKRFTPTKVSIGTQPKPSSEANWGGDCKMREDR